MEKLSPMSDTDRAAMIKADNERGMPQPPYHWDPETRTVTPNQEVADLRGQIIINIPAAPSEGSETL
jgi:hypothetical protein